MEPSENFGDTISGGIQDISALLPLLGTDQCEQHVGEALDYGYLYAAATPLSIFGSLGIVKVSFATLLATVTKPFYGGRWLHNAGFVTTGSVASMVTLQRGTKRTGAEVKLERLIKEQHIDDPKMIEKIHWLGWKRAGEADTRLLSQYLPWNCSLILTSAVSSGFALLPYVYFAHHSQGNTLVWLFPLLRSLGSFLCVVSVQFALQLRIHQITSASLHRLQARHGKPLSNEEKDVGLNAHSERPVGVPDPKPNLRAAEEGQADKTGEQGRRQAVDSVLVILHVLLVVGMGMIVAGYVGCFNLVSQSSTKAGPYIWLGVEAGLSIARMILWGLNPSWDEGNTGMTLQLKLTDKTSSLSPGLPDLIKELAIGFDFKVDLDPATPTTDAVRSRMFPIITSPRHLGLLSEEAPFHFASEDVGWKKSFIAHGLEDFLAAAGPYVGPLERIEVEGYSVYYAVVAVTQAQGRIQKFLCATIVPDGAGWDSFSFLVDGREADQSIHSVFSAQTRPVAGTHALEVVFHKGRLRTHIVPNPKFARFVVYSNKLVRRLVEHRTPSIPKLLPVSWSLTARTDAYEAELGQAKQYSKIPVSRVSFPDKLYMRIGQLCDLKGYNCLDRGDLSNRVTFTKLRLPNRSTDVFVEYVLMLDSAIQEIYLCIVERRFAESVPLSERISHWLALQWIQKMEARLSAEKASAIRRVRMWNAPESTIAGISLTWDSLSTELRSLRLLPGDERDDVFQLWGNYFNDIRTGNTPADFKELVKRPPFNTSESRLIANLSPVFDSHESSDAYPEMIGFVKSSIESLHSAKSPPCFGRIYPRGSGSPEFSPPYTFLTSPPAEEELRAQTEKIVILTLRNESPTEDVYKILPSLPTSKLDALTTVVQCGLPLTNQMASDCCLLLQEHQNITFVLYDDSRTDFVSPERSQDVQRAVDLNRQKWREDRCTLRYQIGLGATPGLVQEEAQSSSVQPIGYDLLLHRRFRVTAMIHIPVQGEIFPVLLAKAVGQPDLKFVAVLAQISEHDAGGGKTWESELVGSLEWQTLKFDFPCVPAGIYEVYITPQNHAQYAFRDLVIDFSPTNGGSRCVRRGILRVHTNAVRGFDIMEKSTTQGPSVVVPNGHLDVTGMEATTERDLVTPDHQDLLETTSSPEVLVGTNSVYRFQFSLHGPEGWHQDGSFTFSPETPQHGRLDNFTMTLSLFDMKLRLDRYWADPSVHRDPSGVAEEGEELLDQWDGFAAWSELNGTVERPEPGEHEVQPKRSGEAFEEVERDGSEAVETQGPSPLDFAPPRKYRFQFSLRGPVDQC
ncbi:hypothetical protein PQX77_012818 [Marasmius sp. AFHP31]|nr:hypothetical protein PQX77_012818 [Marasmius sp. AFHP31]